MGILISMHKKSAKTPKARRSVFAPSYRLGNYYIDMPIQWDQETPI